MIIVLFCRTSFKVRSQIEFLVALCARPSNLVLFTIIPRNGDNLAEIYIRIQEEIWVSDPTHLCLK
jgi:hypothetical protein